MSGITFQLYDRAGQRKYLAAGERTAFLKPDLTPPERTAAEAEGWILGLACDRPSVSAKAANAPVMPYRNRRNRNLSL